MKSPFPGLNPYLEGFWSNVHTRMMTYICDQLQSQLPEGLWSRVEESVTIDDHDADKLQSAYPDSHITDEQPWAPVWNENVGGLAVAEPLVIAVDEPLTERHIEITDTRSGGSVVTAIEVLSPSNKTGAAKRSEYKAKQQKFIRSRVNLVEIDLIRSGSYILSVPPEKLPDDKLEECLVSVFRANIGWPEWEVYPIFLREPLPAFRIPLRHGESDVALDLQAVLDQCYENGRFHIGIDYTQPPVPHVAKKDRDWLDKLLRKKGLRS